MHDRTTRTLSSKACTIRTQKSKSYPQIRKNFYRSNRQHPFSRQFPVSKFVTRQTRFDHGPWRYRQICSHQTSFRIRQPKQFEERRISLRVCHGSRNSDRNVSSSERSFTVNWTRKESRRKITIVHWRRGSVTTVRRWKTTTTTTWLWTWLFWPTFSKISAIWPSANINSTLLIPGLSPVLHGTVRWRFKKQNWNS